MLEEEIAGLVAAHGVSDDTPGLALLIAQGGDVLYRGGFGLADVGAHRAITPDDNFIIASNTKQMCCLCVLMLAEHGLVDLEAPVRRWFPDFPDYVDRITLHQMMAHTAGVPDYYEEGFDNGFSPALLALDHATLAQMLDYIKTLGGLEFEPDTNWAYSNSTYLMLGDVVRQVTGLDFGVFLEREVLRPLGMNQSFAPDDYDHRDCWLVKGYRAAKDGQGGFEACPYDMFQVGFADGNVSSNVDDILTWHRWLYDGVGPKLVTPDYKRLLTRNRVLKDGRRTGYGLGLILGDEEGVCPFKRHLPVHAEMWHSGGATGFISLSSRFVDDDVSIILLCNNETIEQHDLFKGVARLVLGDDAEKED